VDIAQDLLTRKRVRGMKRPGQRSTKGIRRHSGSDGPKCQGRVYVCAYPRAPALGREEVKGDVGDLSEL